MTTITIERGLLEQALAALSAPNYRVFSESSVASKLRAALSAPATTTPEPFAYTTGTYGGHFTLEPMNPAITIPKGFALYLHPPATAPEQCWCRTCRPITQADNRMVLCPDCGNKRCPKATGHRNACTGSNEPGQPGSSYPTVPATAPEHLDPADLCDVCKEPVRYGSRHHACGEAMLRAKANAAPATAPDELERLRQIAHLTGTIFCYGNFVAETHNEAVLEKLLRENGTFWDSVEQYEKSQGWIP